MGTLLKKLTTLVKDGIIGTVSLPLEDKNHEEKVKDESDAHKGVLGKNKTLLQNQKFGSRRNNEKSQGAPR